MIELVRALPIEIVHQVSHIEIYEATKRMIDSRIELVLTEAGSSNDRRSAQIHEELISNDQTEIRGQGMRHTDEEATAKGDRARALKEALLHPEMRKERRFSERGAIGDALPRAILIGMPRLDELVVVIPERDFDLLRPIKAQPWADDRPLVAV